MKSACNHEERQIKQEFLIWAVVLSVACSDKGADSGTTTFSPTDGIYIADAETVVTTGNTCGESEFTLNPLFFDPGVEMSFDEEGGTMSMAMGEASVSGTYADLAFEIVTVEDLEYAANETLRYTTTVTGKFTSATSVGLALVTEQECVEVDCPELYKDNPTIVLPCEQSASWTMSM
jgi:hypothetical protein